MIRAGIDMGSNWIKFCIMDTQTREKVYEKSVHYLLVKSLDSRNNIPKSKIDETVDIIQDFVNSAIQYNCRDIQGVGTAGLRIPNNSEELINKIYNKTGIRIRIINGLEEATFTWRGALSSFNNNHKQTYVEIDIGGGSTEISYGTRDRIIKSFSVPIGSALLDQKFKLSNRVVTNSDLNGIYYFLNRIFKDPLSSLDNLEDSIFVLTGSSGFLPVIRSNQQLTDILIKKKPLWPITIDMVKGSLNDVANRKEYFYSKDSKITDTASIYILYYLMDRLNIKQLYYSTLGLNHGVILERM